MIEGPCKRCGRKVVFGDKPADVGTLILREGDLLVTVTTQTATDDVRGYRPVGVCWLCVGELVSRWTDIGEKGCPDAK